MKENNVTLLHGENSMLFNATKKQRDYLDDCTYNLITPGGKNYQRTMELIAYNALSGNMLVKEKVAFGNHGYEKLYVVSGEGKPEKYKGENL